MDNGIDIPGPAFHESISHWVHFNLETLMCETWGFAGPHRTFPMMTRMRPMVESEIISQKLIGHSREAVLHAHGVDEEKLYAQIKQLQHENTALRGRFINWSCIKTRLFFWG